MRPTTPSSAPSGGHVRLTLAGEDVEIERGARLGALRPRLAEVLGRSELLAVPLAVGPRVLDDDALVGFGPLVPGADVRVHVPRRRAPDLPDDPVGRARDAFGAAARWEVVAGPGAGRVEVDLGRATRGRVAEVRPRRASASDADGPRVVRVRRVRQRRTDDRAPRVRVRLARDHARRRPVRLGLRGRRVRDGDVLHVGPMTLRRVVVGVVDERATIAADATRAPSRARGLGPGLSATTLVVPLVSAATLALVTNRPAFALVGLVGPVVLGVTALIRRLRRTPPAQVGAPTTWHGLARSPVELMTRVATGLAGPSRFDLTPASTAAPGPVGTAADGATDGRGDVGPRALVAAGPSADARARATVLAFAALRPGAPVTLVGGDVRAWEWARWLGARPGPLPTSGDDAPRLAVVTPDDADALRRTSEWWAHAPAGTHVLLVPPLADAPAWCEADVDGPGVDPRLAESLARALAPAVARSTGLTHAATVPLADLLGLDPALSPASVADAVTARWAAAPTRPLAPVGRLADGSGEPFVLDLVRDGPHGLVAGTTGAGKSELLQTLVLSLALTHPPAHLTFVLLDHKGGAGFGPCLTLPHVAGVATDLEPGSARRALAALRAELRSREELLAHHSVPDVGALLARDPEVCPPRLVVVVDELRALADDDPDLVPSFLRIAAQGRSLGLHLVLATQRPAGAVSADVRANVGLRVALRVASDAESRDVVDVPDAAALPASSPGLAVVLTSGSSHRTVRCALASAPATPATARVRRVPRTPGPARTPAPVWGEDVAARLVAAADAAAGAAGAHPLWAPPLPLRCSTADVAEPVPGRVPERSAADALPVALLDEPDERRRSIAAWDPARGHLHVEGAPGSGRSTVLHAVALEAARRGWHVHVLGPDPLVVHDADDPLVEHGARDPHVPLVEHDGLGAAAGRGAGRRPVPRWLGTHAPATDPRRVHELLSQLLAVPPPSPTLVLVDGVEEVLAALGRVARGGGVDTLVALARQSAAHGVALALASARSLTGPLASTVGPRLVLTGTDRASDLGRGVPSELAGLGGPPGRGVWTGAGPARLAQAFLPTHARPSEVPVGPEASPQLVPLPTVPDDRALRELDSAAREAPHAWLAPLGHGGDDAGPRLIDVARDTLVVGPPGSGRSTVLGILARHAAQLGPLLVVGSCLPPTAGRQAADDDGDALRGGGTDDATLVVPMTPEGLARVPDLVAGGGWTLVVDDADVLARLLPVEHDRLATLPGVARCLVAATTASATLASRGLLARVRAARHGVVLDPGRPGAADVLATEVAHVVEPGPCAPGRGALVVDGRAELIQCRPPDSHGGAT
ncbi:hypothetical protein IGS67_02180 [Flavimobilis sp. GY10621]|uniref:FtsK domain-containing protein n=1 Tax=Flavimobilis rhizosphaerae TaxID=2775421 RepID=A0ABR9DME3_9MICO|nr:FtsK/SpoIIIE domain-containing protein [Flavimobilis rhizosphaerae]MBD9698302.1 hypothetical protein [Flavimobilis rhizosphaerae]